jgi:SAM-dependent methyltransferase
MQGQIDFGELWQKFGKRKIQDNQKFWDIRAESFSKHDNKKEHLQLIRWLREKGAITTDHEILDVGCGAGKYIVDLALISKNVIGIDISSNMVKHAMQKANEAKVDNVNFMVKSWEEIDLEQYEWKQKFDLVFASMSPAIRDEASLIKMNEASKGFCFMSGFIDRKDKLRNSLESFIFGDDSEKKYESSLYYAFNILWQNGIYPEIQHKDVEWINSMDVETASQMYSLLFNPDKDLNVEHKIQDFIKSHSIDGKISESTKAKIGWMLWKVK